MLAIVLCIVLGADAQAGAAPAFDPRLGFVFPASHARDLLRQCSRDVPRDVQGVWQPTRQQIRELEAGLPGAFARALGTPGGPNRARVAKHALSDFGRQYGGLIVAGRKNIYVNAFPMHVIDFDGTNVVADVAKAAREGRAVSMCDSGPVFFGVEYDPQTRMFGPFAYNGEI